MFKKEGKLQVILHLSNEKLFYRLQSQLYLNNKHIFILNHLVSTMILIYYKVIHWYSYGYIFEDLAYMGNSLSICHVFSFGLIINALPLIALYFDFIL